MIRVFACATLAATCIVVPALAAFAKEADIGPARRAYRAECVRFEPPDYCECITAAFSQEFNARELGLARLAIKYNHVSSTGARERAMAEIDAGGKALGFRTKQARQKVLDRADALEAELRSVCTAAPRG
jgi:hypothetical protein